MTIGKAVTLILLLAAAAGVVAAFYAAAKDAQRSRGISRHIHGVP